MPHEVKIHEVGLRDGLQVEKQVVPFETIVSWATELMKSGIDFIQLGSFVHPEKVPQMADTDRLFEYFSAPGRKPAHVTLSGLVLNEKGFERGLKAGVEQFCIGVSASDTHSRKNTGMPTDEAMTRIIAIGKRVIEARKSLQVSVQSAFGCGFEGRISEDRVVAMVQRFVEAGFRTISLADTAGHANPDQVQRLFTRVVGIDETLNLTCHFHDTYGLALANCFAAYKVGVRYFESAFGGLGGCPFTAVAAGNVATEDLVHMFQRMGLANEVELDTIASVSKEAEKFLGRTLPGLVYRTGPIPEIELQPA